MSLSYNGSHKRGMCVWAKAACSMMRSIHPARLSTVLLGNPFHLPTLFPTSLLCGAGYLIPISLYVSMEMVKIAQASV